jgi:hypothetical protein
MPTPSNSSTLCELLTFHLILVTWVFFRATSLEDAMTVSTRAASNLAAMPVMLVARLYGFGIYVQGMAK